MDRLDISLHTWLDISRSDLADQSMCFRSECAVTLAVAEVVQVYHRGPKVLEFLNREVQNETLVDVA